MSTALFISLGAVAISLFVVFVARRGSKTRQQSSGDGGSTTASDASGSDCSVSDGGACDGGGGD
ncbi:hypothetical protein DXH95_09735 [Sphingorhabdus pulchriflava]|uniref:Uncharacterized protein n=1 Tax=Sphingorhabdus pulchriflava TaxID=2292257 RepID=A0A371BJ23_9SPHN|nr:hypothetical protein [Sphingorhabdus pulchriflava]RDV07592.1 hypothetical protein DXH95_09735 [Sphingorhabdus pulchriflava]